MDSAWLGKLLTLPVVRTHGRPRQLAITQKNYLPSSMTWHVSPVYARQVVAMRFASSNTRQSRRQHEIFVKRHLSENCRALSFLLPMQLKSVRGYRMLAVSIPQSLLVHVFSQRACQVKQNKLLDRRKWVICVYCMNNLTLKVVDVICLTDAGRGP